MCKFLFKQPDNRIPTINTHDPVYDLLYGPINPAELLEFSDQAEMVIDAVNLVKQFLGDAQYFGVIKHVGGDDD